MAVPTVRDCRFPAYDQLRLDLVLAQKQENTPSMRKDSTVTAHFDLAMPAEQPKFDVLERGHAVNGVAEEQQSASMMEKKHRDG